MDWIRHYLFTTLGGGLGEETDAAKRRPEWMRFEFLMAFDLVRLFWLMRLCNFAWRFWPVPSDWQAGVVAPVFKNKDHGFWFGYGMG